MAATLTHHPAVRPEPKPQCTASAHCTQRWRGRWFKSRCVVKGRSSQWESRRMYFISVPKIDWLIAQEASSAFKSGGINIHCLHLCVFPCHKHDIPHCYDSTFHLISSPGSYLRADVTLRDLHQSLDIMSGSRRLYVQRWNKLCCSEPLKTWLYLLLCSHEQKKESWSQARKSTESTRFSSKPQSLTKSSNYLVFDSCLSWCLPWFSVL